MGITVSIPHMETVNMDLHMVQAAIAVSIPHIEMVNMDPQMETGSSPFPYGD